MATLENLKTPFLQLPANDRLALVSAVRQRRMERFIRKAHKVKSKDAEMRKVLGELPVEVLESILQEIRGE